MEVGFPQNLIRVIMYAITFVSMGIKWNEKQTSYFNSAKGLRLGDPIHPIFLFCVWISYRT